MPTVGSTLSAERIRQGLDVADIARITKLTPRAIQSIEADDFEQLPGLVFARNFVRQYADALGLDPAAISRQFEREQSLPVPEFAMPEAPVSTFVPRPNGSAFRGFFASDAVSAFATFLFTLGLCGLAFYGFQHWSFRRAQPVNQSTTHAAAPQAAAQKPVTPAPVRAEPVTPAANPVAEPTPTPPEASPAAAAPVALTSSRLAPQATPGVHVELTANQACWTRITADGKVLFAGTLAAGESRVVDAASVVTFARATRPRCP